MYLKYNYTIIVFICFLILPMWTIFGCDHNADETEKQKDKELTFAKILNDVFVSCSACHLDGASSGGLDLSKYENIVNKKSTEKPGLMHIKPGDPDNSYLYMKVTEAEGISGGLMPLGGQLTTNQLDLLRDWILAGAPEITSE